MAKEYKNNHYVPIWYQKRFVVDPDTDHSLYYLNLNPPEFFDSQGKKHIGKAMRKASFKQCFAEEDLYTTNFNNIESEKIEKYFFGDIDTRGRKAVEKCADFSHPWDGSDFFNELLYYMSTQKLRTPKGLAWLGKEVRKAKIKNDKNSVLSHMIRLRQMYDAIWMECVWLIADASKSDTKFIISDHPVTVYNRRCEPSSYKCKEYNDPDIRLHASHTIFPLSLDKILILTNLSWVRNPYQNGLEMRPNPNFFRNAVFHINDIQTSRFLTEEEVRQINFIIKKRAYKYVAAAKEEWLYPERYIPEPDWGKFGRGYLLMPDPRSVVYGGQIMMGWKDGTVDAFDEYGRRPGQSGFKGFDKSGVDDDWNTFHQFQGEFARLFGAYRKGRSFNSHTKLDNENDSEEYHKYHLGLEKNPNKNRTP